MKITVYFVKIGEAGAFGVLLLILMKVFGTFGGH
jgi:hypothetical protein